MSRQAAYRRSPAIIQMGRVVEVDASRWLCRVRPEGEDADLLVSIPSLYSHPINGEGIHFLPEEGAVCYICRSSDNERMPFLLMGGAAATPKDFSEQGGAPGSMDMFRPFLSPGDIALLTRDGNGLTLRRGGITELKGTSLAKILFNPANNQILTIAQHYRLQTFGGSVDWKLQPKELDPDGGLKTQYTLEAKEFADAPGCSVRFRLGATGEDDITLQPGTQTSVTYETKTFPFTLSGSGESYPVTIRKVKKLNDNSRVVDLRVYEDETVSKNALPGTESFILGMDREGDLEVDTKGATRIDSEKWIEVAVTGGLPENKTDNKVFITKGSLENTEPVILGETFLTDLQASLIEISAALAALGFTTTKTADLILEITNSLGSASPYLSSTLESE